MTHPMEHAGVNYPYLANSRISMFFSRAPEIQYYRYISRKIAYSNGNPYKFSHARTALKFGLELLDIKKGQEILIPDFICDVVLFPFKQLDIVPNYYTINDSLEPDWKSLLSGINKRTKAILMVHYFGKPQDISMFKDICNKHNLWLVEDNAHGFGGRLGDNLLGTYGDIGISSPRKNMAILNGAYLYVKNEKLKCHPKLQLEPMNVFYHMSRQIIKTAIRSQRIFRLLKAGKRVYDSQDMLGEGDIPDWGMDVATEKIITNSDLGKITEKRQALYYLWHEWVTAQGLNPVFKQISPNTSPLAFPAFTASFEESKKWFDWGYREGIEIYSWPNLPQEVVKKNGSAMAIWKKLVCFPIHPEMNFQILRDKLNKIYYR